MIRQYFDFIGGLKRQEYYLHIKLNQDLQVQQQ